MSDFPEVDTLSRLIDLAARYGIEELHLEESGLSVTLRAAPVMVPSEDGEGVENGQYGYLWQPPRWAPNDSPSAERAENLVALKAPLTGNFYRSRSPEEPPLAEVGDIVALGQPVALIEAMKFFSDVEADTAGRVVEVVAQNNTLVQHGDVLMWIEPE